MTFGPATHENLVAHIEGLQLTLTKRNAQIAELAERIEHGPPSQEVERARTQGYRRGWRECAENLRGSIREHARQLHTIDRQAWQLVLEGERPSPPSPTPTPAAPAPSPTDPEEDTR